MRVQIRAFEQDSENGLADRFPAFLERLKAHIQTEERVLFERMQDEMPPQTFSIPSGPRSVRPTHPMRVLDFLSDLVEEST